MAQQKSIIKLKGTLGDITFFKSGDGYLAREKGGVEASRIATDPAFQRTRENGAEFARAGQAGKLLRLAFQQLVKLLIDRSSIGRLVKLMSAVIKADQASPRGERKVTGPASVRLERFEFNSNGKLSATLYAPYTAGIDRVTGKLTVSFLPFIPLNSVVAPTGATHFRIITGGAAVDFQGNSYESNINSSDMLPFSADPTPAFDLVNQVSANSTHPLFLVLGIEFYQEVNGSHYPLKSGAFNTLSIVKVLGS